MSHLERKNEARQRLEQADERATPARVAILQALLDASHSLLHQEVEETLRQRDFRVDRVTVYRALDWLVKHRFAHKIASGDRSWRFSAATPETEDHAHFHCTNCGRVFCLDEFHPAVAVSLPDGFRSTHAELTVQGLCSRCPPAT